MQSCLPPALHREVDEDKQHMPALQRRVGEEYAQMSERCFDLTSGR
jgi:hypothetical protein